jgi:glucosamine-6-phosphate deaminase
MNDPAEARSGFPLRVFDGPEEIAARCAEELEVLLAGRAEAVLLLPAGRTPEPLFAECCRRVRDGSLDLSRAHAFQLDEMVGVSPEDPRSFAAFLRSRLLEQLSRTPDVDHLLDGTAADPAAEIRRHAVELRRRGDADLALLGLGRNGHVAFNEPGSSLDDAARLVELHETTRRGLEHQFEAPSTPTRGMTLGLAEIRASRAIRILVTGASKREVLARLLAGPPGEDLPASLLLDHPDVAVYADRDACPDR